MATAEACCDQIIGGEVFITVGDKRYEAMADVTIEPMSVDRAATSTSGGRMVVTEAARIRRAAIVFANLCDADPIEIFEARCKVDVTIVEKTRKVRHLFTAAAVVGTVSANLSTGEISGIEVVTDKYVRVGADGGAGIGAGPTPGGTGNTF